MFPLGLRMATSRIPAALLLLLTRVEATRRRRNINSTVDTRRRRPQGIRSNK